MMRTALLAAALLIFPVNSPLIAIAAAGEPSISIHSLLAEMTDRDAMARYPTPYYACKQASSYDRLQTDPADAKTWFANKDYEQFIRTEENEGRHEWVIMEHEGPGCIVRFWAPLDVAKNNQTIRFYFDGEKSPAIAVNFNELLSGRAFVKPPFAFVASDEKAVEGVGGDMYLPIPFAKACKITLDKAPFYYLINYRAYEAGTDVKTFSMLDLAAANATTAQTAQTLAESGMPAGGDTLVNQRRIETGATLSINLPAGSAAVRWIEVRVDPRDAPQVLRSAVVEATFDNETTVWCPLGEFFGCGARLNPVEDWCRRVDKDGSLAARWVMPYRESARLAIKNCGKQPITIRLTAKTGPWQWDDRSMYFHANWRHQYPIDTKKADGTTDWNYIEAKGQGVYVGDTLTVLNPEAIWYGEGDEKIYIDGEKMPSHLGTGTEDYYGYAWGMAHAFNSAFLSMPRRDSQGRGVLEGKPDWRGYTTTSRLRLLDGIPWQSSLKLDMEIWHWAETKVAYSVGSFWYARPGASSNRVAAPAEAAEDILPWPPKPSDSIRLAPPAEASSQIDAVQGLLQRRLPQVAERFDLAVIAKENGFDVFELESTDNGRITLRGSTGVAMATGLNWYLKHCCNRHISWCGSRMDLAPEEMQPIPDGKKRVVLPHRRIVYMNYCTFSYSAPWWDWDRWQWEIDFMALNGVNMPLGIVGLEAVWYNALLRVGLTDEEARAFLVGPAYLPFQWMACIESHCGPLPKSWIDSHLELGRKVIDRQRAFGMTPIQQGFSGHVPVAFKAKFPQAGVVLKPGWCGFSPTAQLDPLDPLFGQFGRIFLEEQSKLFGLGGYYAADPFHESEPPRPDAAYLIQVGETIHKLLDSVDPNSVWVMQSWSIRQEIACAVPKKRLLVVDLDGSKWDGTGGFWGHDFVVGQLHNFGGRINLHGDLAYLARNPFSIGRTRYPNTALGMGLLMEGITQNPVFYDLFFDMAWREGLIDLDSWLNGYVARRYGVSEGSSVEAWRILRTTAYREGTNEVESSSIVAARPAINVKKSGPNAGFTIPYPPQDLRKAWELLLADQARCRKSDSYRFDVVDIGRQVLSNLGQELHKDVRQSYEKGDKQAFETASTRFLDLLRDIDRLCETRKEYRFGDWLAAARNWGTNEAEVALYDKNASMLLTLWGPENEPHIFDYAWREWSGLIREYYLPRWAMFHAFLKEKIDQGDASYSENGLPLIYDREAWHANAFYGAMASWEMKWITTPKSNFRPHDVGEEDELAVANRLNRRWAPAAAGRE